MNLNDFAHAHNQRWKQQGLERTLTTFGSPQLPRSIINDKEYLLFASSDYLGLSTEASVISAACDAGKKWGVGSGGSRLTTGNNLHPRIERELADFFDYPDAVFFATGYQCNLAVISTLSGPEVTIFSDAKNHASIIDGTRLGSTQKRSPTVVYPHLGYERLDELLAARNTPHALVVSDGVFSMSGEVADLARLKDICERHGAWLLIDDAHGIGTIGATGRGCAEHFHVAPDIVIGTASKALGSEGGFALCSAEMATLLRNQARGFVFSTAPSPMTMAAVSGALSVLSQQPARVSTLRSRIRQFYQEVGLVPPTIPSPIICLLVGPEDQALRLSAQLKEDGIFIPAIRYPTVDRGAAMLRLTITSSHSARDITTLTHTLRGYDSWSVSAEGLATS